MKRVNRYEHADLFLLRLWASPPLHRSREADARTGALMDEVEVEETTDCYGTLRRITEGKLYRFSSLQGLMDLLQAVVRDTNGGKGDEETY